MDLFNILAVLITLTAVLSFLNHRYVGLPTTIGVMLIALVLSLLLNLMGVFGLDLKQYAETLLRSIPLEEALLHGMLSFLLFAGALHININDLMDRKWSIGALATVGTLISVFLVGTLTWWALDWVGLQMSFIYCLLFGALISPTDPIAVLSILKRSGVSKTLEMKISGESLFNDGIGVVAFLIILEIATGSHELSAGHVGGLFVQEAVGGALFGLGMGYAAYLMLKSVDNYQVEVLITLALVTGGYALADTLHVSGPIAVVMAGILIGNQGRLLAMSETTRDQLDTFWELMDEILNAVLFVILGMEILILTFNRQYLLLSLVMIPLVILSRFIAVGIPISVLRPFRPFSPGAVRIMTWAGLRGGISVALALSIPPCPERRMILVVTYAVVVFSILVQGVTIKKVVERLSR